MKVNLKALSLPSNKLKLKIQKRNKPGKQAELDNLANIVVNLKNKVVDVNI